MMSWAELGVGKPRAGAYDHDRRAMVTDIDPDLLVAARRREGRNCVNDGPQAGEAEACRHAHHVGFSDAAIIEARLVMRLEAVEQLIADIAGQQDYAGIRNPKAGDLLGEGVPHGSSPNSRLADNTSSAVGIR